MSFLMTSIKNGDIKKAEELIKDGACVDAQDKDGNTAAHYLVQDGWNKGLFEILKSKGDNIFNKSNNKGQTDFQIALDNKVPIQILKKLIETGADPKTKDKNGKTAVCRLQEAEETARLESEILNLIKTEFMSAVENKDVENVIKILENNKENKEAIINVEDYCGNTAAHHCIENRGSEGLLDVLIAAEADFNIQNISVFGRQIPLHIAAKYKKENTVIKLLKAGDNVNIQNKDVSTAAHILMKNNCNENMIDALIKAEADFNIDGEDGKTVFQLILDKGVSI